FPLGKLVIVAGVQGVGKSIFTIDMAARVSRGAPWPDDQDHRQPIGSVVLLENEDALGDTVRPRLDKAKADVHRVHAVQGVQEVDHSGQRSFDLQRDLLLLSQLVEELGDVRLVVLDPLNAYMGKNVKPKDETDVRRVLHPLADFAEQYNVTVIGVSHLNKAPNTEAIFRVKDSVAYTATARAVWLVGRDKEDPELRLLLSMKMNLAKPADGLAYRIGDGGQVEWIDGKVDVTAEEVLGEQRKGDDEPGKLEQAVEFLHEALANGSQRATDIIKWATQDNGIAKRTLERAKAKANVKSEMVQGVNGTTWFWSIRQQPAKDPPTHTQGGLGDLGDHPHRQDRQHHQHRQPSVCKGEDGGQGSTDA
ncbi:MAG: AAA family ATPase, partial [Planctomycetota bacterium]